MANDITYPITLGTYSQTLGTAAEKMMGPAVLIYPIFRWMNFSEGESIKTSLSLSFFLFGIATIMTQFTLIYTKSKREAFAEYKKDTWIIEWTTDNSRFIFFMTKLAALAEGLTAAAAICRFGLKASLSSIGQWFGSDIDDTLIVICALLACFSRYKKINYVDSQEVRNEYEKRRLERKLGPLYLLERFKYPFEKRVKEWDPKLTNYLSYQISPNLENILNILGPYMLYSDVSQFMPDDIKPFIFAVCAFVMTICCYGEYCAQLQDSKWYRDNAYRSYQKKEVDAWKHSPYGLGKFILEIAKLPGRFALCFPENTDPTNWIYTGIRVSKIAGYTALIGAAPIELYKVLEGETSVPSLSLGLPLVLLGMTIGFFAARGQCYARDTGLRNIAAFLASTLGVRRTQLRIPPPENYYEGPRLWSGERSDVEDDSLGPKTFIAETEYCLN